MFDAHKRFVDVMRRLLPLTNLRGCGVRRLHVCCMDEKTFNMQL
eukprot:COSAG01_NODE_64855_length_275_cov_0.585227_1_plen_43_part_10